MPFLNALPSAKEVISCEEDHRGGTIRFSDLGTAMPTI